MLEAHESSSKSSAVQYFVSSEKGTDPVVFDEYMKSIAHNYEERDPKYPAVPWQSQVVNLTPEQAKEVKSQPFIFVVMVVTASKEETGGGKTDAMTILRLGRRIIANSMLGFRA